ncbi:MAG: metalloregulator ArsR/SmtB family transcription factor [Clostridia bacterium]|nr:metalloregulator ArsR/SmtB family transcription factor [Clostridia bacterium]MDE6210936.1 metalloregulator ArsR/SmtB family transcription factor [Clostridia bacterium]MDE6605943.1 metalloregulator ArsR/SmtB family transcription factor [Clostridia bacterium]MDE7208683.1 metalloregulator ArsR/SmtB family transcription factor [Clostridia bacterium]
MICLTVSEQQENFVRDCLPPNGILRNSADYFYIFSDSTRLKILCALCSMELCVGDLSYILGLNQTTISHQLKLLRDNKIVGCRRYGKIVFYRIINENVERTLTIGIENACPSN